MLPEFRLGITPGQLTKIWPAVLPVLHSLAPRAKQYLYESLEVDPSAEPGPLTSINGWSPQLAPVANSLRLITENVEYPNGSSGSEEQAFSARPQVAGVAYHRCPVSSVQFGSFWPPWTGALSKARRDSFGGAL